MRIRTLVGAAGVAIGAGALLVSSLPVSAGAAERSQTGAGAGLSQVSATVAAQVTLSPACTTAFQALKSAAAADRTEDQREWSIAKTDFDSATDQAEDAAERGQFQTLFANMKTACATSLPATLVRPRAAKTLSAQCTAALQAVKAFWAQGRPTTRAKWTQLFTLVKAARTACGWTWPDRF